MVEILVLGLEAVFLALDISEVELTGPLIAHCIVLRWLQRFLDLAERSLGRRYHIQVQILFLRLQTHLIVLREKR